MNNKQMLQCDIIDLSYDGRGIGRVNGKTCFIEGALPAEQVEFRLINQKRNYDEGRATQILSKSEHRVEPACKHFSRCGGCSLQHLDHHQQLELKQQQLLNDLQRGGLTPKRILPALSAPQWGYRRRARLAVQRAKDGKFLIGFRNAGSQRVEPITQCPVLTAPLPDVVGALPEWLALLPVAVRVFEVELVSADSSFAIAIEASRLPADTVIARLVEGLHAMGLGSAQLWWKVGKQARFARYDSGSDKLSFAVTEGITVNVEPGQFIQVNGEVNRLMVEQILSLLPLKGSRAIDLYCGTGNLSLPLTQRFEQVIGIEGLPVLVKAAIENARINNLNNVEFRVADLTSDDALTLACGPKGPIDLLLLDPPRNGAAGVMPWIAKSGAKQILYISCHPATMIRDAEVLTKQGYKLSAVGVMGMFPHTTHIEAMALFEQSKV